MRLDLDLNEATKPLWMIFVVFSPEFQALVCSCSGRSGEWSVPYPKAPVYSHELFFINLNWSIQSSLEIKIANPTPRWFGASRPCIIDEFLQRPPCPEDLLCVIYYLVAHAEAPPSIKETKDKGIFLIRWMVLLSPFPWRLQGVVGHRNSAGVVSESNAADSLGI